MADDPIWSLSKGSSISPNAWSMRMSALNLAALAAMPETTPSTCASSFREYVWPLTGIERSNPMAAVTRRSSSRTLA